MHACGTVSMKALPLWAMVSLGLVTSCDTPRTLYPSATPEEIAAERSGQEIAAYAKPLPAIIEPVYPNKQMRERLQNVANRVTPEASRICMEMFGGANEKRSCSYGLQIKGRYGVNAYADGQNIIFTAPMLALAVDDTHLAYVMAHELAHNIMQHIDSSEHNLVIGTLVGSALDVAAASQGAYTSGSFSQIGAETALLSYSPAFEQEADYVGLYIVARAGYPIENAPYFWRAMAQRDPSGIYSRRTHPSYPERFVAMRKAIAEIRAKQQAGLPVLPNFQHKQ